MAELGVETILTLLPVCFAQASTPCLQISYSWPNALQEIEIDTIARHVEADQNIEIRRMQEMLAARKP